MPRYAGVITEILVECDDFLQRWNSRAAPTVCGSRSRNTYQDIGTELLAMDDGPDSVGAPESVLAILSREAERDIPASEVRRTLIRSIGSASGLDPKDLLPSMSMDELGLDSLNVLTILTELEMQLGIFFPVELLDRLDELRAMQTLGEVVHLFTT
jgi:acyl carrier protein